jgi:GTPase SAR1 family protein
MPLASQIFTGRQKDIQKLAQYFSPRDKPRPRRHFLLVGMGGVGKTQICLKFVEDYCDQ